MPNITVLKSFEHNGPKFAGRSYTVSDKDAKRLVEKGLAKPSDESRKQKETPKVKSQPKKTK